ncbi:spore germination protein [Clostridium sp. Cult2]|uniref:spore germination protein n=1 Tax=Clostridium sp. Cult2 TaxID=2079003 RepID=UPI001F3BF802|nr:spore germination protein [Clostridium sp. Cult2]MCF6464285.1 spore germination protein [Clostridium sp. Cult2]
MISKKIKSNEEEIINLFNNTSDLVTYEFETSSNTKVLICYIEGLINKDLLDRDIIKPIINNLNSPKDIKNVLYVSNLKEIDLIEDVAGEMTYGSVGIFINGINQCYVVSLNEWEKRAVEEPQAEAVVRGPKEGFIEDILVNKAMLRRRIRNKDLVFEDYTIGKQTKTKISISYIQGLVNEEVLKEVKKRIGDIDIDGILESGYIEQLIEDSPTSLISTIGDTQKPDVVAGKLLEGRIGVFCDGSPHVLTIPKLFIEDIQASEDYYSRPFYATFLRWLRVFSLFLSIVLPGLYVALQTFHQEMIPTVLLITMAGAREGVPFPAVIEAFVMILILELIKESGIRLPRAVGSAVSIVGALVLGQAAVEAGLVSAPMVIVVAATAIAEFAVPSLTEGIIIYRFMLILLGGFMGLYAMTCGLIAIIVHIISLNSFGVPYGFPLAPSDRQGLKDSIIRFPLQELIFRPKVLEKRNMIRQRDIRKK